MKIKKQSDGFAMIEVLIAIVVLAIGLLAGSRMQILGLNYTQAATSRSFATMAATDILDRIRLNPDGLTSYHGYDTGNGAPGDQNCGNNACDPVQRANQDLRMWARYFREGDATDASTLLPPGAVGTIALNGAATVITITWDDFIRGEARPQTISIGAAL